MVAPVLKAEAGPLRSATPRSRALGGVALAGATTAMSTPDAVLPAATVTTAGVLGDPLGAGAGPGDGAGEGAGVGAGEGVGVDDVPPHAISAKASATTIIRRYTAPLLPQIRWMQP